MNSRVAALRAASLAAQPVLSPERARIVTEVYREADGADIPAPLLRARVFSRLMAEKAVYIGPGELIVGERGPAPKETPTFPELCCHSLADLDVIANRQKVSFAVDDATRRLYETEIIPFWSGRSMRDAIFASMTSEWHDAYEAGVFTEFMEQRAPGHTVLDDKVYRRGFLDFKDDAVRHLAAIEGEVGPDADARRAELTAMATCCDAIIAFAGRYAAEADRLAALEADEARQAELRRIADVCRRVPARPPRDFHEALQMYWFAHIGVVTELNTWDSFCPGHLDHHLEPFYQRGLKERTLTRQGAKELLQCFWVKFNNQPAPPKVGVTAAESGTYTDFANINIGGVLPDGTDGVGKVSYLLLEVVEEMHLLQPSSNIQFSARNPLDFLERAAKIIRQGWGQPSVFNSIQVVEELVRQGKSLEDARAGGTSGCVESGAFGKEAYILTGYFNLVKVLEITLHDGVDPRTGKQIGPRTGDPESFSTFDDLFDAFGRQLRHFIDVKVAGNAVIESLYATKMPAPFLSLLIDDCVARGRDYHDGGARYNTTYIMGTGTGTLTDSLSAIKHHVFDERDMTLPELLWAMRSDFANLEPLRRHLWNRTPRYGNDDHRADAILTRHFDLFYDLIEGRPNGRGGEYHVNYLSTTCHVYFGSVTGATPDGRRAGEPLSDGISPSQGADRAGPTALILSAAHMDQTRTGGTLLNMKFTPRAVAGHVGLQCLTNLIKSYFFLSGHHIQFNVITDETLRRAQAEPEKHRDLIVRVAGYSDYFCDLTRELQNEIIARTEHSAF